MALARHEIAIYIHRFHNLDLLSHGWYQLKVNARWEGSEAATNFGSPNRVLQYDVPDSKSVDVGSVWQINNEDHSFLTPPFLIKYRRQDIYLSVVVSFSFNIVSLEALFTKGVVLKFELLRSSVHQMDRSEVPDFLTFSSASVQEVRVPPRALLGLHSYCPLHFDVFHSVLVELSIHVILQSGTTEIVLRKNTRNDILLNESLYEVVASSNQGMALLDQLGPKGIELLKVLCSSQNIFIDEMKKMSKGKSEMMEDFGNSEKMTAETVIRKVEKNNQKCSESGKKTEQHNVFSDHAEHTDSSKADIEEASKLLGSHISYLWTSFLNYHRKHRVEILEYLRDQWAESRGVEWSLWLVHSIGLKISEPSYEDIGHDSQFLRFAKEINSNANTEDAASASAACAELHRKSIEQLKINTSSLQDLQIFGFPAQNPIIYVEHHKILHQISSGENRLPAATSLMDDTRDDDMPSSLIRNLPPKSADPNLFKRSLRVVVFVHGFQGHHLDLRLVRNQWLLIDPGAEYLMSTSNEGRTDGDFREMGKRLAEEVSSFLKFKFNVASRRSPYGSFRLSFVGHSIGNIIIRAALLDAAMKPFLDNLYTYMSIAGPHLGYLYSSNNIFSSGLWLFKKLQGSAFMHQLTFTDNIVFEDCFLFKLSQEKTFQYFQNIVLISAPQDGYVPYHSARIKMCPAAEKDSKRRPGYKAMVKNCIDQIIFPAEEDRVFLRCDVNFNHSPQAGSFNNFIGRTAHIEFLDTFIYTKFIVWSFPKLFS